MKAFEMIGQIDENRQLHLELPPEAPPGRAHVIVLLPEAQEAQAEAQEDEAGAQWMRGVARAWTDELADAREDIYTLADGEPLDAAR